MSYCFELTYNVYPFRPRSTRIFSKEFVERSRNKFKIIFYNKEIRLKEYFEEFGSVSSFLPVVEVKLKLKFLHNILDLSYMFSDCDRLLSIKEEEKVNEEQVKAKSNYGLSISKKKEKKSFKIFDISHMFDGCKSLNSIPDISKWNIEKVTSLHGLFDSCESLKSIPDLSKWNTKNVTCLSNLFNGCKSLVLLPDLSKWNTENVTNISNLLMDVNY